MIRSGSILVGVLFTGLGLTAAARAADIEPSLRLPAASGKTVAVTLDACSGRTDMRIVDELIADGIPATLFVTHRWIVRNAEAIAAGHTFVILLRDGFPLNVLNPVKAVPEVCGIFCATANPVEVVVAVTPLGRGVVGVIDGQPPLGVETDADVADRRALLRAIGYKL